MVLREHKCHKCYSIFYHEDGVDSHGVATNQNDNRLNARSLYKRRPRCPNCDDPNSILGMTYYKKTILSAFRKHLNEKGILSEFLDDDTLKDMLREFPRAHSYYISNSTYRTITILPGEEFTSEFGKFKLGEVIEIKEDVKKREIICCRCNRTVRYGLFSALYVFLGLHQKRCADCDKDAEKTPFERNTSGLNRNGSKASEFSERSIAKALNVSRNDFRRHRITKPEPPLPLGTMVNGLRIHFAWWDDETEAPRYILACDKCLENFICLQKQVHLQQHWCQVKNV